MTARRRFRSAGLTAEAAPQDPALRPALLPLPYAPPVRRTSRRSRENCWVACRRFIAAHDHIDVRRIQLDAAASSWCKSIWPDRPGGSRRARPPHGVKTLKFRDDQIKTVQAAIDRAKKIAGAEDDSAALAIICEDYAEGRTTLTLDWLVETLADYLSSLDADERTKFRAAVNARVNPVAAPQAG